MLRGTAQTAEQTKKYFNESLTREGYYTEGQEIVGEWGGRGAARLDLTGRVGREEFIALCDNLNPATGEKLTLRMKERRRTSYDFTFNCPKSVSLAYEWKRDERILKAFVESVRETMADMEAEMSTRVRKGGRDEDRKTGELVSAEFIHFTARPVGGVPDPLLHAHLVTFNATYDAVEGCWKAAQLGDIMEDLPHYQSVFHTRFAKRLRELGYETIAQGISFELAGISRSLIEKFSRRAAVVEARAKAMGITDPAEKDKLAALTREKKAKDLGRNELHKIWWGKLTPQDERELNGLGRGLERHPEGVGLTAKDFCNEPVPLTAAQAIQGKSAKAAGEAGVKEPVKPTKHDREAVDFAVKHIFYTASVVRARDLETEALKWGCGLATPEGVKEAIKALPLLRVQKDGRELVSTAEALAEETRVVARCRDGIGKHRALNPRWRIQDERLNDQQRDAVRHVLRSEAFITGIVGKAGVGKTTTLLEAARGLKAGGVKVMAFAPTAAASRGTLRESGFPEAETVDKLLLSSGLQAQATGAVWFVDEGGLMSARLTDRLLELAERLGARVVLVGDHGQHHSVERGDAFRLLHELGGMPTITIDKIQRQKGLYRKAVEAIARNEHDRAFAILEEMGAMVEIPDNATRYKTMADDYVSAVERGKTALMVAPTHVECNLVTEAARGALKANKTLSAGRDWQILRNLSWSPAQKSDGRCYEPGLVVKVGGHLKGFSMGEQLEVIEAQRGKVVVRGEKGRRRSLPLDQADKFNVYERDRIEVCKGDRIRITISTRSADGHPLTNGDAYTVRGFAPDGGIVLNNGWHLKADFPHLVHGYANTSHSAQSKSIDVVLLAQSGLISSGATDANQFYTAVSRGKESPRIYTDEIEGLRENVARVRRRELATEVFEPPHRARGEGWRATEKAPEAEAAVHEAWTPTEPAVEGERAGQGGEPERREARPIPRVVEYKPVERKYPERDQDLELEM